MFLMAFVYISTHLDFSYLQYFAYRFYTNGNDDDDDDDADNNNNNNNNNA